MERTVLIQDTLDYDEFKGHVVEDILKECVNVDIHSKNEAMMLLPADISGLTESLILCSASSVNSNVLDALNITCIINVAPELPDTPLHRNDILCEKIPILDSGNSRIYPHLHQAANLINQVTHSGGKTLIYCVAGISRSASICLAYLMKYQGLTLLDAYNYVKLKRPKIKPNCGFFKQLIEFEKEVFGCNTVKMIFNEFVQMEIPDVYDCEYRYISHFNKSKKRLNSR